LEAAPRGAHVARNRAPAQHDPRLRSDSGHAQGRAARAGNPRRATGEGRHLRAPPRASVREAARGGTDGGGADMRRLLLALIVACQVAWPAHGSAASAGSEFYQPHQESAIGGTPFTRYFTTDRFRREITFYLSDATDSVASFPLIVHIQGS